MYLCEDSRLAICRYAKFNVTTYRESESDTQDSYNVKVGYLTSTVKVDIDIFRGRLPDKILLGDVKGYIKRFRFWNKYVKSEESFQFSVNFSLKSYTIHSTLTKVG